MTTPTMPTETPTTAATLDDLKAQLAQLDALAAEGVLTGDAARQSRDALERQVLAAVMQGPLGPPSAPTSPSVPSVARAPRRLVAVVAVFVLAFGLAGYALLGNRAAWQIAPGDGSEAAAAGADSAGQQAQQAQIAAMVAQLEARLQTEPGDAASWQMLARSYGVLGRYPEAVQAHQRVVALKPQDAQALADLADALAMANNKTLDGEPERLIAQAVKLDPSNIKALALAGTVAFNHSDYAGAVAYWERAVQAADPNSGYAQQLAGALDEARQRAGQGAGPAAAAPASGAAPAALAAATAGAVAPANPTPAAVLSGRVSVLPALRGQVGPEDTVFIFARAPVGSRMPLAILRKKVSDLPLDFTLDDSLAMSPAARLSSAQQVVVGARISKSGNAMPSPGDFQVLSAPVPVDAKGLKLEIGTPVP